MSSHFIDQTVQRLPAEHLGLTHGVCDSETWMGTTGAPATGGARKAIRQIMIVNNVGTHQKQVGRLN